MRSVVVNSPNFDNASGPGWIDKEGYANETVVVRPGVRKNTESLGWPREQVEEDLGCQLHIILTTSPMPRHTFSCITAR